MKIGFFIDAYNPKWFFGTEASLESFKKGLEEFGHDVFIYAPKIPNFQDGDPRIFRFSSIKVIKKPEIYLAFPFFFKNRLEELSKIVNPKLDIVHTHSPFTMGLLGLYIANYQKTPLLYTHHTHFPEYAKIYLKEKIFLPKISRALIKWFANKMDEVITPSIKIKRLLRSYNVKTHISILPTGVDFDFFQKFPRLGNAQKKKLKIPSKKKVLLFVGRQSKEKNPEFLLLTMREILKKRKDVFLLMVGDGPDLEKLKNLTKKFQIENFVRFTGQIPHQEIPAYYQLADIFVFPSLTEAQGVVILEAMANSLPVVVLRDEAFQGVVFNNKNGFVIEKPDFHIFSEKIIEILDSPQKYRKFSQYALETAINFSIKNQSKKLLDIYQRLIEKYCSKS